MEFEIEPYAGVGPVRLGMAIQEVRQALGEEPRTTSENDTGIPSDLFTTRGILVHYRQPGITEAVEFGDPSTSPTYQGKRLLSRPFEELRTWFEALDPGANTEADWLTSYKLGVGLYAPSAQKEPNEPVEGVIVFDRGYYER